MSEQTESRLNYEEMQKALSFHIWKNNHLREEILENPKATIERELGVKFDDDVKITLVSQSQPNELIFTLPCNIHEAAGQELTDDQLEEVSGGMIYRFIMTKIAGAAGANDTQMQQIDTAGRVADGAANIVAQFVPYGSGIATVVGAGKKMFGIE